jgi:adenine-specific DNA-methyltransferase
MMDLNRKREFAAYYTPSSISELLCSIAIKKSDEIILEPSFGGCSFLESSWNALSKVGSRVPQSQIFGCDVDRIAFKNLKTNFPKAVVSNFIQKDFLKSSPSDFSASEFTTIIGNPPFLPIDKFKNKELAWNIAKQRDLALSKKSSLWAYFVLHSLNFLRKNGNLYFVVPDSLSFTNYGKQLTEYLKRKFEKLTIIRFEEKFFQAVGTPEKTSFLLCEGYETERQNSFTEYKCDSLSKLDFGNLSLNLSADIGCDVSNLSLRSTESVKYLKLSDVAECRIGIVTGANDYLLQSKEWLAGKDVPSRYFYPVLSKSNELTGIQLKKTDVSLKIRQNQISFLIDFPKIYRHDRQLYYRLKRTIPKSVLNNATFDYRTKTKKWFMYDDKNIPDLFLSYHTAFGPRVVINTAKLNTTNSLHRVYLKRGFKSLDVKKIISISLLTSISRNSASENGRRYGSGILKLEPGDAKNVLVPIPISYSKLTLNNTFKMIDKCLRNNDLRMAIKLADKFVFNK